VAAELPFGHVTVEPTQGGLNVVDQEHDTVSVVATAGIAVYLDLPEGKFTL
jgi:hypothetical protein